MNIHIKDKNTFASLVDSSIIKFPIGSKLYNLDVGSSDKDYLYIYAETEFDSKSINYEHHQLQFKEDNVDHNFTTPRNFIRNLITGDSTINFECLFSTQMRDDVYSLSYLYNLRYEFCTFNLLNSYLGLVRRDLKIAGKYVQSMHLSKNFSIREDKPNKVLIKKIYHIVRGLASFVSILDKNFSIYYETSDCHFTGNKEFETTRDFLINLRNNNFTSEEIISIFENCLDYQAELKLKLQKMLLGNEIAHYPTKKILLEVDYIIRRIPYYKGSYSIISDEYLDGINGINY